MTESVKSALTSWRTTAVGLLIAIAASVEFLLRVAGVESIPPATIPDWLRIGVEQMIALGFISSRDNKVSSEKAGAE